MKSLNFQRKFTIFLILLTAVQPFFYTTPDAQAELTVKAYQPQNQSSPRIAGVPNDPLYEKQAYLNQIYAQDAWALHTGSVQVTVAILDSGVDINHPDLKNNIWVNSDEIPGDGIDNDNNGYVDDINGWDFVEDNPDPRPKFSGPFSSIGIQHGTLLAGVIAAEGNNGLGMAGISWRSKIMPLRILDNRGEGDVISVVKAIDYAITKKVDVINLSFVSDVDSAFLRDAMKRAYDAGIIIVAASGNDQGKNHGKDIAQQRMYPVCYDFDVNAVIGVAALDALEQKAPFSNYGHCIDVSAPGMNVYTTQVVNYSQVGFDAYYGTGWSGTSIATAMVTGALALAKSVNKDLTPKMATDLLKSTCTSVDNMNPEYLGRLGCGELNVGALVQATIDQIKSQQEISFNESTPWRNVLAIAPVDGKDPLMFFDNDGTRRKAVIYPYDKFRIPYAAQGSRTSAGMFVVGVGAGLSPHVRIFNRDTVMQNQFFAYPLAMKAGITVALGDVDGDGDDEVITVPGRGAGSHVKIFSQSGMLKNQFFAYHPSFRGGLRLAIGDLNNDKKADIIITPIKAQKGFENDVRIFDGNGVLRAQFFAYPKKSTVLSCALAIGDTDGDGSLEIITAPAGKPGQVRVFSSVGKLKSQFYPYTKGFAQGVFVASADVNQDQKDEIIVIPASNAPAHVRMFSESGTLVRQFFASEKNVRRGYVLTVIK
jgi:subtilisin family serine protease